MTDEQLIARLRDAKRDWPEFGHDRAEAADRIEALTAKLTEAVEDRDHWSDVAGREGVCMSCCGPNGAPEPYGCTDCLNTGYCGEHHNTVHDLEAKLASGVVAEYDDGSVVCLSGYAGGAAVGGAWSTLTLMEVAPDGAIRERKYKAQGDWCATLAAVSETHKIKGESHD